MLSRASLQLLSRALTRHVRAASTPALLAMSQRRLISSTTISSNTFNNSDTPPKPTQESQRSDNSESNGDDDVPWYLRSEESSTLATPIFKAEMPTIPTNAPDFVEPLMRSLIDLGLDELKVFDLRGREEEIPLAERIDFAVVCQGKSAKHLQNAAEQLMTTLKHNHDVIPFIEGLVKPNSTLRMKRRLKQKKPDNDFGLEVNSWVMLDTQLGLVINILTPERRKLINLEYIWCKPEEKHLYEPKQSSGLGENDSVFAGIFRRFYSTSPDDLPLEVIAVQCFQIGDFKAFEATVVPKIRQDPSKALTVLDTLMSDLVNSEITTVLGKTPEESGRKAKQLLKFINSCTPARPTLEHWKKRYQAIEILTMIFPNDVPFRHLTTSLLLQASSGISIAHEQLSAFMDSLSKNMYYNPPSDVQSQDAVNSSSRAKLEQFSTIMETFSTEHRADLPDEIVLKVLKLGTQQHMYLRTEEVVPVSTAFDVLLDLFGERKPTMETVEFVLVTYLKANEVDKFWAFWDNLYEYKNAGDHVIIDERPWSLLADLLVENEHDKLIEEFLSLRLRDALDLGLEVTEELKIKAMAILNRFDESGVAYSELRENFNS